MSEVVTKLNEILADEWACVRALRKAEASSDEPGQREVLKRVRKDCSFNCVALTNVIRALGGRPTDVPSGAYADDAQAAQRQIITKLDALLNEPALQALRTQLAQVQQLHRDDVRWLGSVLK